MKVKKVEGSGSEKPRPIAPLFAPAVNARIEKVADMDLRIELGLLITEIEEMGKKLYSSKGRKEFEEYKAAVKKFMGKVLTTSFRVEEQHGKKKDGKFVVYLTMQRVDDALDNLAQMLLAGQQDSMRLVAVLDEIRGMLLDMYL
jgi:uncharacterized protein